MKIPILKLKDILLTSIQVDLIDEEALDFQNDVLKAVTEQEARGIIIDITALTVVDSFLARIINELATMVQLVGCEVVICGMNPSVALTLVEMGREMVRVETALNLDAGMEKIQKILSSRNDVVILPEKED